MASQLIEFLEGRKVKAAGVDWEKRKAEWLNGITILYADIRALLHASIDQGVVKLHENKIEVAEDFIGTYEAKELRLAVGADRVVFTPVGANVFGAQGRVDLKGDRGRISLLWNGGSEWQFVEQRLPELVLQEFNEASLLGALQSIMAP
jgi:hypothetical protein